MTPDETQHGKNPAWPVWKIAAAVSPFVAGAAAINIFFIGLMIQAIGLNHIPPTTAIAAGLIATPPAALLTAKWIKNLINKAEME